MNSLIEDVVKKPKKFLKMYDMGAVNQHAVTMEIEGAVLRLQHMLHNHKITADEWQTGHDAIEEIRNGL